jgi:hypothetical protein
MSSRGWQITGTGILTDSALDLPQKAMVSRALPFLLHTEIYQSQIGQLKKQSHL